MCRWPRSLFRRRGPPFRWPGRHPHLVGQVSGQVTVVRVPAAGDARDGDVVAVAVRDRPPQQLGQGHLGIRRRGRLRPLPGGGGCWRIVWPLVQFRPGVLSRAASSGRVGCRVPETARGLSRRRLRLPSWTFRISSGVSQRIYKSVVQGDREFLRIGAGVSTLYKS